MNENILRPIERMKQALMGRVDEWLGIDIPEEGTEDYEIWQCKLQMLEDITTFSDVIEYLECENIDVVEFFNNVGGPLISIGIDPGLVPSEVVQEEGDEIAKQQWSGGSWVSVYSYDGYFFVLNEVGINAYADEKSAIDAAGIGNTSFDDITYSEKK